MSVAKPPLAERTLPRLLARRAEHNADGVLFDDEAGVVTAGEAWSSAGRVAAGLHDLGIASGDRVAVMLDNCREFLQAWFGIAILGAVQVPINPQAVGTHLTYVLRHAGVRALVVDGAQLDAIASALADVPDLVAVVVVGQATAALASKSIAFDELVDAAPRFDGWDVVTPADSTAIMYTSGSTGSPKGVVLPHGQHVENGWQATTVAGIQPTDRLFVCLPLHHNMAQGYGVMPALVSGASFHLARRFKRATFWDQVRRSESTVWPFVGAMLVLLAKDIAAGEDPADENPLRVAYGVPIPTEVHRRFEEAFQLRLIPCYGSTEATIPVWGSLSGDEPLGSCGTVLPDFDIQIQAPDGCPVPAGEVGEVCVRPREPSIMFQGYHNEPERGRLALRNLWFHSGDRGRIDSDGYFWFAGRTEDVVRRFGEFISATQVEEVVLGCPSVDIVAAFGVADDVAGEELMVTVVPRSGAQLTAREVRDWCRRELPAFSVPRYIDVVDQLPMTATGKVEKYVLRRRGPSAESYDARNNEEGD